MPAFFVGLMALLVAAVWLEGRAGRRHRRQPAGRDQVPVAARRSSSASPSFRSWRASCRRRSPTPCARSSWRSPSSAASAAGRFSWRYLIRPSIAPTLSLLSYIVGSLFASAVVVELVFNLPGTGHAARRRGGRPRLPAGPGDRAVLGRVRRARRHDRATSSRSRSIPGSAGEALVALVPVAAIAPARRA